MQRPARRVRYIEYLLAIAAGVVLINTCAFGVDWEWMQVVGVIVGGSLILLHFLKFVKALQRDVRNYVVLQSDSGSVRVDASALEEALRHTMKSLPEVADVHVRLVLDPQTNVPAAGEVEARIKDITNIVTVHDALSRVLRERYQQIIPGAPPIEFNLTIKHHFKPPQRPSRRNKRMTPPEEDETKAIRAPQYPVPD